MHGIEWLYGRGRDWVAPSAVGFAMIAAAHAQTPQFTDATDSALDVKFVYSMPMSVGSNPFFAGGAVGDFNRDGWQDLFVLGGAHSPDRLYINNGDGTFTDQAAAWGVDAQHFGVGAAVADFDGDGWLDIYVTSFGDSPSGRQPGQHKLYRNNGDGTFTDVAVEAGVAYTSPDVGDGFSAAWGDYDLDGHLDLAVTGWFYQSGGNRLFRNNGDGTFTDVTTTALPTDLTNVRGFAPRFADMDGDGWPELLWVGDYYTTVYFQNMRDGTFSDATVSAGVGLETNGMGQTVGDFSGDGRLDWYVTSIYFDLPPPPMGNMLYINQGGHVYTEISGPAGVRNGAYGWATVAVDLNNNGWLDIVETNGWGTIQFQQIPPFVWLNQGNLTFQNVTSAVGLNLPMDGRGLLNFDYDNNGTQDLVFFNHEDELMLFRNDLAGPGTHWLRMFLDTSNRTDIAPDGIGARVVVRAGGRTQVRVIEAGSNYLSQSEMSAHFGLGAATVVNELRVQWPGGGTTAKRNVAVNQTLTLRPPSLTPGGPQTPAPASGLP